MISEWDRTTPDDPTKLKRLYNLSVAKLSVVDEKKRVIKLQLANGKEFFLKLYAPTDQEDAMFESWRQMIQMLKHTYDAQYKKMVQTLKASLEKAEADPRGIKLGKAPRILMKQKQDIKRSSNSLMGKEKPTMGIFKRFISIFVCYESPPPSKEQKKRTRVGFL
ncbi:uncharacterized protein O3C94_017795 [Discoglossus pictus]